MEMYSVIGSQYDLCTIVLGLTYRYKYLATIATLTYCMQEEDNRDEQHKTIETGWLAGRAAPSSRPRTESFCIQTQQTTNRCQAHIHVPRTNTHVNGCLY